MCVVMCVWCGDDDDNHDVCLYVCVCLWGDACV